jgi:hypothetical protein
LYLFGGVTMKKTTQETSSSEPKDSDMVSVGAGRYSQYNDPHSQTETPKEERALEEYVNSLNNQ